MARGELSWYRNGVIASSIISALLLVACSSAQNQFDEDVAERDQRRLLDTGLFRVMGAQARTCLKRSGSGQLPELAERALFEARQQPDGRLLPINAQCVSEAYTVDELRRFSDSGDPVAAIGFAFAWFSRPQATDCASDIVFARRLEAAGNVVVASTGRSRVPEAYILASDIYRRCGYREDADRAELLAYRNGYNYIVLSE